MTAHTTLVSTTTRLQTAAIVVAVVFGTYWVLFLHGWVSHPMEHLSSVDGRLADVTDLKSAVQQHTEQLKAVKAVLKRMNARLKAVEGEVYQQALCPPRPPAREPNKARGLTGPRSVGAYRKN
jgi:hypothetical protein